MRCRRAFDVDLPLLLEGHGDDPEFLSHYTACPDCAAEVGAWRELHGLLRVGVTTNGTHPSAEELVALVDHPGTLGVGERAALEHHVASCRPCGDEARLLRTIDVATAVAASVPTMESPQPALPPPLPAIPLPLPAIPPPLPAMPPVVDPEPEPPPRTAPVGVSMEPSAPAPAARRGGLSRLVWHPAFAYALVAVLLVPLIHDQLGRLMPSAPEETVIVVRRAEPAAPPAAGAPAPSSLSEAETAEPPAAGAVGKMAEPRLDGLAEPRLDGLADPRLDALAERREQVAALRDAPATESSRQVPPALARSAAPAGVRSLEVAPASRPVLDVRPDAFPTLPLAAAANGALLRIATPTGIGEGVVDVRVRRRTGGRELFERLTARADAIELEIPADWLVPGDYEVTVEAADGRRRARQGGSDTASRSRLRFAVGPAGTDEHGVAAPGAPR